MVRVLHFNPGIILKGIKLYLMKFQKLKFRHIMTLELQFKSQCCPVPSQPRTLGQLLSKSTIQSRKRLLPESSLIHRPSLHFKCLLYAPLVLTLTLQYLLLTWTTALSNLCAPQQPGVPKPRSSSQVSTNSYCYWL